MTGKLSVVIPAWSGTPYLAGLTLDLCKHIRGQCDELIVSEDGIPQDDIAKIADKYLTHSRFGHGDNLKAGFDHVTGDFVGFIDSDIRIKKGTLRDLCVSGSLVCPTWIDWREYYIPQTGKELWVQWFVVGPRVFFEKCPPQPNSKYPDNHNQAEAADRWGDVLRETFPTIHSDAVTYCHSGRSSYGVLLYPPQ